MKIVNSSPITHHSSPRTDGRGFMKLSAGAKLLGVSSAAIIQRKAPRGVERLTLVNVAKETSQRPFFMLVEKEVIELYDELLENARQRTNVDRMIKKTHLRDVSKAVNG